MNKQTVVALILLLNSLLLLLAPVNVSAAVLSTFLLLCVHVAEQCSVKWDFGVWKR